MKSVERSREGACTEQKGDIGCLYKVTSNDRTCVVRSSFFGSDSGESEQSDCENDSRKYIVSSELSVSRNVACVSYSGFFESGSESGEQTSGSSREREYRDRADHHNSGSEEGSCVIKSRFFKSDSESSEKQRDGCDKKAIKVACIEVNENRQQLRKVENGQEGECGQGGHVEEVEDEDDEEGALKVYPNSGNECGSCIRSRTYVTKVGGRASGRRRKKVAVSFLDETRDAGGVVTLKRKDPYGKLYVARSRYIPGQYGAFLNERVEANTELAVYSWTMLTAKEVEDKTFIFNATEKVNGQEVERYFDGVRGDTAGSFINDALRWDLMNVKFVLKKMKYIIRLIVVSTTVIDKGSEAFGPYTLQHWHHELRGEDTPLRDRIISAYFINGREKGRTVEQWLKANEHLSTEDRKKYKVTPSGRVLCQSIQEESDVVLETGTPRYIVKQFNTVQTDLNSYLGVSRGLELNKVMFRPIEQQDNVRQELLTDRYIVREAVEAEEVQDVIEHCVSGWDKAIELLRDGDKVKKV